MREIGVRMEEEGGTVVFTFRFKALRQLLDEADPMPLPETELTEEAEEAEEAIAGYLDECRVSTSARPILELPEGELERAPPVLLAEAVRHHFGFRIHDLTHDLKISAREGSYSLIVAVVNVAVLVVLAVFVTRTGIPFDSLHAALPLGFLTILSWVTIWHTYEHFVYDYRDLNRNRRIFRKLTTIPLAVRGY